MASSQLTFSLVPRRRLIGLAFGGMHSSRRGMGSDLAGSRPYVPGDDMDTIDWAASAKLSAARGQDEFIVREHFAEEAPYVVCICDRRPAMANMQPPLPWLSKPEAMRLAVSVILKATGDARGFAGYLDFGNGEAFWTPPTSERHVREITDVRLGTADYCAPEDSMTRALVHLAEHRRVLPPGSFVFCISDFLEVPLGEQWVAALERRWDVVPVVIQDPIWEQSFPDVSGIAIPLVDSRSGGISYVRLTADEAFAQRQLNEHRSRRVLDTFRNLGLEPILLSSTDPDDVATAFSLWSEQRLVERGRGW